MTDALKTLWQDSPPFDVEAMVARLHRHNRDVRFINLGSAAISLFIFAILVGLEWSGNLHTGGMMTFLGVLCIIGAGFQYVWEKRRLQRAFSREPGALLAFMIKRTKAAINLGRMLYICPVPSMSFGYLLATVTPDPEYDTPMPDWIDPVITGVALGFLIVPTALGIWFTRKKVRELKELEALAAEMAKPA